MCCHKFQCIFLDFKKYNKSTKNVHNYEVGKIINFF